MKTENQKLKLLYLVQILWTQSQEEHPLPMAEIIRQLESKGVRAERKSVYNDMQCLTDFGFDIGYNTSHKNGGYYLASREFELPELKIMVDMVQSSRFLSEKKSRELIHKLETLTDRYDAQQLQRSVYVSGRAKTRNETIYYSVDSIHQAINGDYGISFQYQQYNGGKCLDYRHGGKIYEVSPYYLVWNNENYYLIAYDEAIGQIRHYRVDRMKNITVRCDTRMGQELFSDFDVAEYTSSAFGMFGGAARKIRLECEESLAGVVIDRFGDRISLRKLPDGHFSVTPEVVPSRQFYGWLAGLGNAVRITSPEDIKQDYLQYLRQLVAAYEPAGSRTKSDKK